jgi:hypothetical protein
VERNPNPYAGILCAIEIGAEDSTDPRRIADGTAGFNVGLPPVDTVIGHHPNGKPVIASRPVTHNELGSNRKRREYAKRHGLEPLESRGQFRAVGK